MNYLNHEEFCNDVGRPLERKRTFKDVSACMKSACRAIEDGSMDWDLVQKERLFSHIEFLAKFMDHINDGLLDIHKLTRKEGRLFGAGTDSETMNRMNHIANLVESIIPREYRRL